MNKELIHKLRMQAIDEVDPFRQDPGQGYSEAVYQRFAELLINEAVKVITNYEIPVGDSTAGEIACDMTYRALVDIRKQIRETLGVPR